MAGRAPGHGHLVVLAALVWLSTGQVQAQGLSVSGSVPATWGWVRRDSPESRYECALAYDSWRGMTVMFGGGTQDSTICDFGDTWEWNGVTWSKRAPVTGPHRRTKASMAYDSRRRRTVLFGGLSCDGQINAGNDTWEWDGTNWTEMSSQGNPLAPPRRWVTQMVYDAARGKVVLFGGNQRDETHNDTGLGDTWEWDGSSWSQVFPPTSPSPRALHAMAYDLDRSRIVLLGGASETNPDAAKEVWEYDGRTWMKKSPATLPIGASNGIVAHQLVYDVFRKKTVLFGGSAGEPTNATWEWDGVNWTRRTPQHAPPRRYSHAMAYDLARGRTVMFGGFDAIQPSGPPFITNTHFYYGDTWEFDGGDWIARARRNGAPAERWEREQPDVAQSTFRQVTGSRDAPPARHAHGMVYDPRRAAAVLFGGYDGADVGLNDTWSWDGVAWTQKTTDGAFGSPPRRQSPGLGFDPQQEVTILFGGQAGPPDRSYLDDTWTFDGTAWGAASPASRPSLRFPNPLALDATRGFLLLFGGQDGTGRELDDTLIWSGAQWATVGASSPSTPPARVGAALASDPNRRVVVLFGGSNDAGALLDTWEWNGTTWTARDSATEPSARSFPGMAYDSRRRRTMLFGGIFEGTRFDELWQWDGTSWLQERPGTSPPPTFAGSMIYDSTRERLVLFGGSLNGGANTDSTWELPSDKPPRIQASIAPSTPSTRQLVTLFSGAQDPDADPLEVRWLQVHGPPVALANPTAATATFTATAPGVYAFEATVSDGRGSHGYGLVETFIRPNSRPSIVVNAPPSREQGEVVRLDGSATSDPDLDTLSFAWSQIEGAQLVSFSTPSSAVTTFLAPRSVGLYRFRLAVTELGGPTTVATTSVQIVDTVRPTVSLALSPSANITSALFVGIDATFSEPMLLLDLEPGVRFEKIPGSGSGSVPAGKFTSLSDTVFTYGFAATAANNGTFVIRVDARDRAGLAVVQPTVNARITVNIPNRPPSANSGPEQTVPVNTPVTLNGTASFDPDGEPLTYGWSLQSQPAGSSVSLSNASSARPSFTPILPGAYVVLLSVSDAANATATSTVTITASAVSSNRSPVATVSPAELRLTLGGEVRLDGSLSSDPDAETLSYSWSFGPKPDNSALLDSSLNGRTSPAVSFVPDKEGTYNLLLTVSDGRGGSDSARAVVAVQPLPPDDYAPDDIDNASETLEAGRDRNGTLGSATDSDFLKLAVSRGLVYTIALSSEDIPNYQLELFDETRRNKGTFLGAPGNAAVVRDFRPLTDQPHYVRVSSPSQHSGRWLLRAAARAETQLSPPKLQLSLAPAQAGVVATVRTSGTSVPLSALTLLISYDAKSLRFLSSTKGPAAVDLNLSSQQFETSFIDVSFQKDGLALLPAGVLQTLTFGARASGPLSLAPDSVTILRATVTNAAPAPVTVLRPSANAGVSLSLDSAGSPGGAVFPDPLSAGGARLERFVRLDGRFSSDGNTPPRTLVYHWTVVQSQNPDARPSDPSSPTPSFDPGNAAGLYRFGLQVSNGVLESPKDTVSLVIERARVAPSAAVSVSSTSTGRGESPGDGREELVLMPGAVLRLDGRQSTDPAPSRRANLVFDWRQIQGPSVGPIPATSVVELSLALPGAYLFELRVRNDLSIESDPASAGALVSPAPLRLTVTASARSASAPGGDLGADERLARVTSLRTLVGEPVTLDAAATGASKLGFFWRQVQGPPVAFRQSAAPLSSTSGSRLEFTTPLPGVLAFECSATALDEQGNPTLLVTRRVIRILADAAGARVPGAAAAIFPAAAGAQAKPAGSRTLQAATVLAANAGDVVTLDASGSTGGTGDLPLGYAWRQVQGPPVVLSNPFSSVATFVAPDIGTAAFRACTFQLFCDDGRLRSEPAVASIQLLPEGSTACVLTLTPGLNFIGAPVAARREGRGMRLQELVRDFGATVGFHVAGGRFRSVADNTNAAGVELSGGAGYLLHLDGRSSRQLLVSGPAWPNSIRLDRGLNLVSIPSRAIPPSIASASGLLGIAPNARYVVRLEPRESGASKFEIFLPGLTRQAFRIEPGRAYLLVNSIEEELFLPDE